MLAWHAQITEAGGQTPYLTPRQTVVHYFADLRTHRYYAAYLLEASCTRIVHFSNGPGAPSGGAAYHSRGTWNPNDATGWRRFLPIVRVLSIGRYHDSLLAKGRIRGFLVRGYFVFDYSHVRWPNYVRKSGYHVVKIAVWRCGRHWGVDPQWLFAPW